MKERASGCSGDRLGLRPRNSATVLAGNLTRRQRQKH
jgi:hypothetical protein